MCQAHNSHRAEPNCYLCRAVAAELAAVEGKDADE